MNANVEEFLNDVEKKTGDSVKDEISELLEKLADNSDGTLQKVGEELEKELDKLTLEYYADENNYKELKEIEKTIENDILGAIEKLSRQKSERKAYLETLTGDIRYLILYKLFFLIEIRRKEVGWIQKRREEAGEETRCDPYNDALGLAFSGGGIRSATFNLGLLQALERCSILKSVDYLSTVSGGGYIGSSLTWFMSKEQGHFPFGTSRKDHGGKSGKILSWLRDHGCYLTPGNGLNLWTLIAATLSTVLVNLLVLVPVFLIVFYFLHSIPLQNSFVCADGFLIFLGSGVLMLAYFLLLSIIFAIDSRRKEKQTFYNQRCRREFAGQVLMWGFLLLLFGAIPFVYSFVSDHFDKWTQLAISSISLSGLATFLAAFRGISETNETRGIRSFLLSVGLMLMVYGVLVWFYHVVDHKWISGPLLAIFIVISLLLAWRTNINHVSMHRYYRNRLMEAYMPWGILNATQTETDSFFLQSIRRTRAPYHIINTTVNLVGSEQTKQRERGGDSFIFSPLFCGSEATGYAATEKYAEGKVNLATAFAISGAAVNPNTYVTRSKPITFFMTLLNARLGYWINNPRHSTDRSKHPFAFAYYVNMFSEMFGKGLDEKKAFVHLSDGGHFENLGLYELIRRRCRYIIVSDAGNDPGWSFGDLARVIEMVRVDFGAHVDLNTQPLQPGGEERIAKQGFITGTVTYKDGTVADLIYINTVIIEGLPEDIYSYRRTNPRFPDQTTSDQFFDEKQFEAYRELGFQIGHTLCNYGPDEDFTAIFRRDDA